MAEDWLLGERCFPDFEGFRRLLRLQVKSIFGQDFLLKRGAELWGILEGYILGGSHGDMKRLSVLSQRSEFAGAYGMRNGPCGQGSGFEDSVL